MWSEACYLVVDRLPSTWPVLEVFVPTTYILGWVHAKPVGVERLHPTPGLYLCPMPDPLKRISEIEREVSVAYPPSKTTGTYDISIVEDAIPISIQLYK